MVGGESGREGGTVSGELYEVGVMCCEGLEEGFGIEMGLDCTMILI